MDPSKSKDLLSKLCESPTVVLILCLVSGFIGWFFLFGPTLLWDDYGLLISIKNEAAKPVTEIHLVYNGGEYKLDKLEPGQKRTFVANTIGKIGGFSLTFKDENDKAHGDFVDMYELPKTKVDVWIESDHKFKWRLDNPSFSTEKRIHTSGY